MDKIKLLIASRLLNIAADEFENHGCNDLPSDFFEGLSADEKAALIWEFQQWIDPDIEQGETWHGGNNHWMNFISEKLATGAE